MQRFAIEHAPCLPLNYFRGMFMNFIHTSDIHLGCTQYNIRERFYDFARTFKKVMDYAIDKDVEFILISGDLFHKRNINAPTYMQAFKVLNELKKESEIPVYAIEGNHDLNYHRDKNSWLQILDAQGLLKRFKIKENKELSVEWMGDYVDINGIRIFGVKYIGAITRDSIPKIANEINTINKKDPPEYTILMMHFGMEGQLMYDVAGEISYNALLPLRNVVDYLALGHYHLQYEIDDWIFNGGSLETVTMNEYKTEKGFYHVKDNKKTLQKIPTRPIERIFCDISDIKTPHDLYVHVQSILDGEKSIESPLKPLVELVLYGNLNYPKSDISTERIKDKIQQRYNPLWSNVKIQRTNEEFKKVGGVGLSKEEIELKVLKEMIKADGRYNKNIDLVANTIVEVKNLSQIKVDKSKILSVLRDSFEGVKG